MNKIKLILSLIGVLFLLGATGCQRDGKPKKQSTSKTKIDHLQIKEVFYLGHAYRRDATDAWYYYDDDQYIIIYNPTDEVKYLDGLALCSNAIDPTELLTFAPTDNFVNRYYGANTISYFPGNGTEHPIPPKGSVTVAKYAIDHREDAFHEILLEYADEDMDGVIDQGFDPTEYKEDSVMREGYDAFLDLSKADFEWTYRPALRSSEQSKNNSSVPDMIPILRVSEQGDGGTVKERTNFAFSSLSERGGIALIKLPWTPEDFAKNYIPDPNAPEGDPRRKGYRHAVNVTSASFKDFYVIEVPLENVIDCMTVCPKTLYQMRSTKLDRGYNAVVDVLKRRVSAINRKKYSGLALTRKYDGRKFVDDDNSTTDFEVKTASLSRKDAKGNLIK